MVRNNNNKGFTVIEVVLVLAIAGLLFIILFFALPALQRAQRDTQRKEDSRRFIAQTVIYQANNQRNLPDTTIASPSTPWNNFISNYLTTNGETFMDPFTRTTYTVNVLNVATAPSSSLGTISVYPTARCVNGAQATGGATGPNQIAVMMPVEQGSFFCTQN